MLCAKSFGAHHVKHFPSPFSRQIMSFWYHLKCWNAISRGDSGLGSKCHTNPTELTWSALKCSYVNDEPHLAISVQLGPFLPHHTSATKNLRNKGLARASGSTIPVLTEVEPCSPGNMKWAGPLVRILKRCMESSEIAVTLLHDLPKAKS